MLEGKGVSMPITIQRAIEVINENGQEAEGRHTWEEYLEATKLGREALIFKQSWRKGILFKADYLLPSEAEE
jgi:hypothetical protein